MKTPPDWFTTVPAKGVRKPHQVSTRMLVEDEQGLRYAKVGAGKELIAKLRRRLPMGVSIYMPVYLLFVKAVNLKMYSVYACYNDKLRFPLFYTQDISCLGKLH